MNCDARVSSDTTEADCDLALYSVDWPIVENGGKSIMME